MTLYSSTRGQVKNITFEEAVMMGLADDGGLLVPNELPHISDKLNFTLMSLFLLVYGQLGSGIVFKKMNFKVSWSYPSGFIHGSQKYFSSSIN